MKGVRRCVSDTTGLSVLFLWVPRRFIGVSVVLGSVEWFEEVCVIGCGSC